MRQILASFLALCTALPPATFAKPTQPSETKQFQKKLSKDTQALHALDRLTFGPRPGDLAEVRRMGVKKWVDQQLHPERIAENPVLAAKLQPLESLRMSETEVAQHYPPPQVIKAYADGKRALPEEPVLRASIERLMERYKAKKGTETDAENKTPPLTSVLSADQIRTLRSGTPADKRALIDAMPADKLASALIVMPPAVRQQVFAVANQTVRRQVLLLNAPQQVVNYDLLEGKLARAVYSNRQLAELMTDFWFNHFNVFLDKGADRYMVPAYERDAIQPYVFGRFRDLLEATAKSPAMLFYLDNWQSVFTPENPKMRKKGVRGLNENYARELMELHTLGVDGGYTQKDIVEVARCFTGWTISDARGGGSFSFNPKVHDKGEKVVLGVTIPAGGGQEDGMKVLDILANHASTARFISKKLAQRFVADNPPNALIDRMAAAFTKSGGDIRVVMKTMLDSKEFWSVGAYQAKVKTPFEMIVSSVRATGADMETGFQLAQQIANLGQPLYRKVEPTGYSTANAEWVNSSALLARMNFALALAQNKVAGVKVDASRFGDDPSQVAKAVLFRDVSPATLAALQKALSEKGKDGKAKSPALIAGLVLGSPEFQRR